MSSLALVCRSGSILLALPLDSVAETMRPLPIEPLAEQPCFVRGVSVVRGAPVPIVDVAALLGTGAEAPPRRVVTLNLGVRQVGLALDAVIGVRAISVERLKDVPPLLLEAAAEVVEGIAALDDQLLLALRGAFVVPPSVWSSIDARTATQ
jgi:purine-binding chemotaxis protein CheW